MPDTVQFENGNQIINTYASDGRKLKSRYYTPIPGMFSPITVAEGSVFKISGYPDYFFDMEATAYVGNKEYEATEPKHYHYLGLSRIKNPEGYVKQGKYHYYRRDHLGNNREVWQVNANTIATVQRTNYYPSGLPWAYKEGDGASEQPDKYTDKEFIEMHGLDEYYSVFRNYYPGIGRPLTVDPLAEKYYSISPYAWCLNNPIRFVDPDGQEVWIALPPYGNSQVEFVQYKDNQLYNKDGSLYKGDNEFALTIQNTMNNLLDLKDDFISEVVNTLVDSNKKHVVQYNAEGKNNVQVNRPGEMQGKRLNSYINVSLTEKPIENNLQTTKETTLGHELRHAYDFDQGNNAGFDPVGKDANTARDPREVRAVGFENRIREKQNLKQRTTYGKQPIEKYTKNK